jgi:hypothetical protein
MESDEIYLAECLDCIKRIFILDDNISPAALINSVELLIIYFNQNVLKNKKSCLLLSVCLIWISHKFHDDDSADIYTVIQSWSTGLKVKQIVTGEMQLLRKFAWDIDAINSNDFKCKVISDLCERLLKDDVDAERMLEAIIG